ncbi:MAG: DHA2 family efflux MFS transporter permease subunit [Rhodospirillales bacterium]|nr:DHA2 family efflux MFS transporter permease subunit [Rhodospirillales bacterium]
MTGAAPGRRNLLTVCLMVATLMQALDSTIANVALPYMQGSLSTTADQITWVLTSYVVAAAIMTAPVGWLASRFGRKNFFAACLVGFTVTSMMCGAAQSLEQMVAFRLMQGVCGAALVPLSQSTMMDIYPVQQRGSAMAIWGMGVMVGPILGPTLGGYLTNVYNWRWVFYVNLPFGVLAVTGLLILMPKAPVNKEMRFDWTGFGVLALGIGALQMMLDRGLSQDWFNSREVIIEAVLAGLGTYLFLVHLATAPRPFIPPVIFRDLNFVMAMLMMFAVGMVLLASSALLAPYLQNLAGYPVEDAGLLLAPRGLGTMIAMMIAGRLASRVDPRKLMGVGLVLLTWSLYAMSSWTPDVPEWDLVAVTMVQGAGLGFVFIPLQVVGFATLPPLLRTDGSALLSLVRNVGSAIGISVTSFMLATNQQSEHARLAEVATPFNHLLHGSAPLARLLNPATEHGAVLLDGMINRQATIIAYNDDFRLMMLAAILPMVLLFVMRRPGAPKGPVEAHAVMD